MMLGTTTMQKPLMNCPACKKPIMATISVELGEPPRATGENEPWMGPYVAVKPTGIRVDHNCIPKVTR